MERRSGSPKPGHSFTNDRAKAGKPSFGSTKDDPVATAGVDSEEAHDHQPKTGDRNRASVTGTGGATVRTNTPAPHAGETGAPVNPPDGETPAMAARVQTRRDRTDEGDERPQADPEMPALGEWDKRRGSEPDRT